MSTTGPLRVMMVLENAGAGSGRHVVDLIMGLTQRSHVVTLVCSPLRREDWFRTAVAGIEGLDHREIAMVRGPHPRDLAAGLRLRRLIQADGPFDLIHGHSSKGGALARLAAAGTNVARFYTPHAFFTMDYSLSRPRRLFYGAAERLLARFCDGIICVSEAERQHAIDLGVPSELLFTVNNRLPPLPAPDRAAARRRMALRPDQVCIGFVGRLAPQKAVHRLILAFARFAREQPLAQLAIVGSGEEEARICQQVRELELTSRVLLVGPGDGPALMAGFDVFALPSHYEAFPYVLLEAAERRLPIVTMDVGGAREVVREGVNGFILSQDDLSGFAASLAELCANPTRRKSMGRASEALLGKDGVTTMVDQTIDVYRQVLDRRSGRNVRHAARRYD